MMPLRLSIDALKENPLSTKHGATAVLLVLLIAVASMVASLDRPIAPATELAETDFVRVLKRLHEERISFLLNARATADVVVTSEEPAGDFTEDDQLIVRLKQVFSRHGVPARDHKPCWTAREAHRQDTSLSMRQVLLSIMGA